MIRPLLAASLAVLSLTACSKPAGTAAVGSDPYAGLEREIVSWRNHIEASHPACAVKTDGKGCEGFQVTCKAQQEITADETAKGVVAQVIAAMTFNGRAGADGASGKPGSSFSIFTRTAEGWTRTDAPPVNLSTCAPV